MTELVVLVTALAALVVLAIVVVAASGSVAAVAGALALAVVAAGFVNVKVAALLEDPELPPPESGPRGQSS